VTPDHNAKALPIGTGSDAKPDGDGSSVNVLVIVTQEVTPGRFVASDDD